MDKLKMHSPDLNQENIAKIRDLFPGCVTEARDEATGQLRLAVDFDQLRQELSDSIIEGPQERFRLDWPGKREALATANAPIAKTLRPAQAESLNFANTRNLFLEGDNLDALKLLQSSCLGSVKFIYIDPPYNTGGDFVYSDDFSVDTKTFFERSMQADTEGNRLVANLESNVFLRSVGSYKAVLYQDSVTEHGFWTAKAVDRQINSSETEVSRYWITDFLDSDFKTTSATGTRVLAVAMRNAAKATENLEIKKEITAAATLSPGLNDQVMTANDFIARLGLSQPSREAITGQMRHQGLLNEQFRFSAEEFNRQLPYKSVELHNGAILTAAATEFDKVFVRSEPDDKGQVTYEATGKVISEKLEKVPR
ncbi:hypothetical protein [Rhizobium herbae]|uniref:Site-specific DNA-methyltransferase (adenine-specific) n=1 Tax=Rhizobium herbae TaxID=508661 RepID=A0ABS4EL97_9HYPH|nr:hypothetical protein [Rhizobium herbae]MBP1858678.1 hypothetical protein [Rhizobium herbae]